MERLAGLNCPAPVRVTFLTDLPPHQDIILLSQGSLHLLVFHAISIANVCQISPDVVAEGVSSSGGLSGVPSSQAGRRKPKRKYVAYVVKEHIVHSLRQVNSSSSCNGTSLKRLVMHMLRPNILANKTTDNHSLGVPLWLTDMAGKPYPP